METILYGLFFIVGYLVHATYTHVLGLGIAAVSYKQSMEDCLLIIANTYERQVSLNEGWYVILHQKGFERKEIERLRRKDKIELESTMDVLVGNLISVSPQRFRNLLEFNDWKTANIEVTKIIKRRK